MSPLPNANLVATNLPAVFELGPWRFVHWWLAAVTVAAGLWVRFGGQHRRLWADHDLAWLLWHWFTGGRLEPRRTFPDLADERRPVERLPRRAAVAAARTAVSVAAVVAEYVHSGAPRGTGVGTVALVAVAGTAALAAATLAIVHAACRAAHYYQWVRPLHRAVHKHAGWDESKRPGSYITIPRNRAEGGDGVVVKLAPNFDLRREEVVTNTVIKTVDLNDVTTNPTYAGRHTYLQFRPKALMPASAFYRDPEVKALVSGASSSAPLLGVTYGNKPVAIDLDTESPHILLSAGTGGGKSSMTRAIAAQLMARGASVTIIDVKRHSHRWARGLNGVQYVRDLGDINQVLCDLGRESHRRNIAWDDVGLDDEGPTHPRHVILFEETNATIGALKDWWKNHKEPGDPPTCPGIRYYGQILFTGRAVQMHVISVSQMATAKDVGGPEIRENFATRVLARHTKRNWDMLVPQIPYEPAENHPGRMFVCIGTTAIRTQGIYLSEHEARELAASGDSKRAIDVASVASRETPVSLGKHGATVASSADVDPARVLVTLRQASSDDGIGVVALKHGALRKAAERDKEIGEFPEPDGKVGNAAAWLPSALQRWEANRPGVRGTTLAAPPDNGRNEVDGVDRMEARTGV